MPTPQENQALAQARAMFHNDPDVVHIDVLNGRIRLHVRCYSRPWPSQIVGIRVELITSDG